MAIYHLSAQVIKRSEGRSAVAAAAYRSGEALLDEASGRTVHWSRKDVVYAEVMLPDGVPLFYGDRQYLWNAAEALEKRKDAQLAREINMALPRELTPDQRLHLARGFVQDQFVREGMAADLAIHDDGTNHNPHAHVMVTMRQLDAWGFRLTKTRKWNSRETLAGWRVAWADWCNRALGRAGHQVRIDHRTLEAQGIRRLATIHEGPKARAVADYRPRAPGSKQRRRTGWQRKERVLDYPSIDLGRTRVEYNQRINEDNRLAALQVEEVRPPSHREAWRELASQLRSVRRQAAKAEWLQRQAEMHLIRHRAEADHLRELLRQAGSGKAAALRQELEARRLKARQAFARVIGYAIEAAHHDGEAARLQRRATELRHVWALDEVLHPDQVKKAQVTRAVEREQEHDQGRERERRMIGQAANR